MDLLIALIVFVFAMVGSLMLNASMIFPLLIGFCVFSGLAVKNGWTIRKVLSFAAGSFRESFIVIGNLLIIGCLTGIWRVCGTIAYFVTLGVSLIPPGLFLLAAFLLAAAMSYAIGTSFGVTATAGVILMAIARAGGVNPVMAAGAILSGVYVGDRGSPAASSAVLVSVLTGTDMRRNVRIMLKTSVVPFLICCALYGALSACFPPTSIDDGISRLLSEEFVLGWYCLIPAVLMIALPFLGLKVKMAMLVSLLSALAVSVFSQGDGVVDCLRAMVLGYRAENGALNDMLSGGGVASMLEVSAILLISGTYGGIFRGTGMLKPVNDGIRRWSERIGRFPTMILLGAGACGLFCNQTIGAIMQNQLSAALYGDSEKERYEKMSDMENSVILVAGLVPWCIASSVPLGMLGANARSIPAALYLWMVPLARLIALKIGKTRGN